MVITGGLELRAIGVIDSSSSNDFRRRINQLTLGPCVYICVRKVNQIDFAFPYCY